MSDFQTVKVNIRGVRPLLMHSAAGADPLSEWAKARKAVSGKKNKTDSDHLELARIDWYSSFYCDEAKKPVILGTMLEACCVAGAKRSKQGQIAKASILINDNPTLVHDHPAGKKATADDFWELPKYRDVRGVMISRSRIMRYRPIFAVLSDLDVSTFKSILETSGRFIGIGDYRPKFGLFEVTEVKTV
jgi:hypothetical protein